MCFTVQLSKVRCLLCSNFSATAIIEYHVFFLCQHFLNFLLFLQSVSSERRRRDLNPRAAINDLLPFQEPLRPAWVLLQIAQFVCSLNLSRASHSLKFVNRLALSSCFAFSSHSLACFRRSGEGWDSNPRALADKRFSRPPRYDHFDTSPYML